MKIFNNYEKNLSLYESITRSRKRSIYIYFIIASIFVIFLFFCPKVWYFYAIFGLSAFGFYMLMIVTIYYLYKFPKKVKIFDEILEDYKKNKIIKELNKRGLKRDNIDAVISPYRYIRIAYVHNGNVYTEVRIESTRHGYAVELTPDYVKKYTKKQIVFNFRRLISKYDYEDNKKELTKKEFYDWAYEKLSDISLIEQLNEAVLVFEGKNIDDNNKEDLS